MRGVHLEARDPQAVGAGLLGDLRAQRVVDAEKHSRLRPRQQLLDRRGPARDLCVIAVRASVFRDADRHPASPDRVSPGMGTGLAIGQKRSGRKGLSSSRFAPKMSAWVETWAKACR